LILILVDVWVESVLEKASDLPEDVDHVVLRAGGGAGKRG